MVIFQLHPMNDINEYKSTEKRDMEKEGKGSIWISLKIFFFFFENKIYKLLYRPICISTKDGAREIPFCLLLEFDFDGYKSFLSCQSCHALLFTIFWSLSMQSSIVIIWKTFKSNVKQLLTKGMISTCALNCGVSHTYIMWSSKPKSNYNINVWV